MKTRLRTLIEAGIAIFAVQLGAVASVQAGGGSVLELPIEGVTAENSKQCAELFEEQFASVLIDAASDVRARMIKDGSADLVQLRPERGSISLSEVERALKGSPFTIRRDQLEYFSLLRLRIGKIGDHEKHVSALAALDGKNLDSHTVEDADGSLWITLRDPTRNTAIPLVEKRKRTLITHRRLTRYLSENKIELVAISWGHDRLNQSEAWRGDSFGARPAATAVDIYSPDASHVWNRIYSSLFVRTAGGQVFDDWMDPLFSRETNHFLSGESSAKTVALLGEFEKDGEAHEGATPIQRAVMQRDLLAMFHWARHAEQTPERDELIRALVGSIRHVALAADEIGRLPDNYAIAAGLPAAHTAFDAAEPKRAFLPKDLLLDDGPWLVLEPRHDRPLAAPVHFQIFGGKSAFDLHFRHPEGRGAGERYLDVLAAMPNPFLAERPAAPVPGTNSDTAPWLNPATPQFPSGTMWALVRRAILVDVEGGLVVSPLVESVEIRVYRALADIGSNPEAQTFFEWELSRRLLFGEGGFHLTDGRDFLLSPFSPLDDKVEAFAKLPVGGPLACFACHSAPGIHSVNSRTLRFFTGDFEYERQGAPKRPSEFRPTTRKRLAEVTEEVASKQESWQEFRKFWDER